MKAILVKLPMDKDRILSLLDCLGQYHQELTDHLPKSEKAYLSSIEKRRFCERTLQLLIEICIDISQLLLKELKLGLPSGEESVFDQLKEEKVISHEMNLKLKEMRRFRNVLVHHYAKVDDSLVYSNALHHREDFLQFKKEIIVFIKKIK